MNRSLVGSLRMLLWALPFILSACSSKDSSPPPAGGPHLRVVATGLDTPWEILWGPDGAIWTTERPGIVSRIDPETGAKHPLLRIPDVHEEGESGLLGMALHPDSADTPSIFLVYTYLRGDTITERLVRYRYDSAAGALLDPTVLLDGIRGGSTHDGSRLVILPDRTLVMTVGDAQDQPSAQDRSRLNGKILRLNLDGSIPPDNPFPGSPVWTTGHRNPQGLDIGSNGILYSSEHGPSNDDEVNIIEKGRNYGWPVVEGFCDGAVERRFCADSNVVEPIRAWTPTLATTGIAWYDHAAIPDWRNSLLLTTLKGGFHVLKLSDDGRSVLSDSAWFKDLGRLRDVCVSPGGRVFISTSNLDGRGSSREGDDRILEVLP